MTTHTVAGGPTPALMKEINAAFNSRDLDRIMTLFADDATFLMARGPEADGRRVRGKAAIRAPELSRLRHLRVPRGQDPQQGHVLEAGGAA